MPVERSGACSKAQRLTQRAFSVGVLFAWERAAAIFVGQATAYVCASFPTTGRA
jgi:hypothetical protein